MQCKPQPKWKLGKKKDTSRGLKFLPCKNPFQNWFFKNQVQMDRVSVHLTQQKRKKIPTLLLSFVVFSSGKILTFLVFVWNEMWNVFALSLLDILMYVSSVYSICDDGGIIYVISFLISIILQLQNLAAVQVLHTIRLW